MRTIAIPTRFWKRSVAALGAVLALASAPATARADVCGNFEDIADDLLDIYFEVLGDFFTLSENTCDSMRKTFKTACDSAVKDAEKCWNRQVASVVKASKPGCKETAKNPSACNDDFKDEGDSEKDDIKSEANFAKNDCGNAADDFWEVCRFGP